MNEKNDTQKLFELLKFSVLQMIEGSELVSENSSDTDYIAEQLTADMVMSEAGFNDVPIDMAYAILFVLCGVAEKNIKEIVLQRESKVEEIKKKIANKGEEKKYERRNLK